MRVRIFLQSIGTTPQRFFLLTALVFGLLFTVLIPPFHNPDEPVHFFRVYQLSTLRIFGASGPEGIKTIIPSSFIRSVQSNLEINGRQINFHPEIKASPGKIFQSLGYSLNEDKSEATLFSSAASYFPTSYLPQILAVEIGRVLKLSPVAMLYMARLAGLALYICVIYYSVKLLPYRKWTVALLAVLPMSLAQAGAVTADSSLIAFLILFMAIILNLRANPHKKIDVRLLILLAFSTVALGLSKQIFILATPLLLFVPSTVFPTKRMQRLIIWSLLTGTWLIAVIWDLLNPAFKTGISGSAASADAHSRILSTIHQPVHLVVVMFNTFLGQGSDALYRMFAGDFGWLDTAVPLWVVALVIGVVTYSLVTGYEERHDKLQNYYNLAIVVVAVLLFAATCAVFYIYWTPFESKQILGLQGRYFIPMVILLGLLQGRRFFKTDEKQYSKVILLSTPVFLLASIITILGRYYWSI